MRKSQSQRQLAIQPLHSTLQRENNQPRELGKIIKYPSGGETTILVPVYLRAYLTELVCVSAQDETIKGRFILYLTAPRTVPPQLYENWSKQDLQETSKQGLQYFINNNLSLQCGNQHIDVISPVSASTINSTSVRICNSQGICWKQSIIRPQIDSQQDEQQTYNESFFVTDQSWLHGKDYVTWVVEGVFDCDYQLDNTFFPCMGIKSGLKLILHDQNYHKVNIKYEFMKCLSENNMGIKIFDFKFDRRQHKIFGIYTLNLNSASCELQELQENIQFHPQDYQKRIDVYRQHSQQNAQDQKHINQKQSFQKDYKCAQLGFEVISFNVPFILRYQIPIWTLCFASLVLYFADVQSISSVFANIILISVSQISLFSSFRQGSFKTDSVSMYEISLASSLAASLLLLIDSTDNFQNLSLQQQIDGPDPNFNAWTGYFYVSLSICGAALLANIIALIYRGFKTKMLSINPLLERNHRLCLTWNEDIFKQFFIVAGRNKKNKKKQTS